MQILIAKTWARAGVVAVLMSSQVMLDEAGLRGTV